MSERENVANAGWHLTEAENIRNRDNYHGDRNEQAAYHVSVAQVYATLAVAEATARPTINYSVEP